MRRLLFVCERNTVLGPAASAIFHHMGVRSVSVILTMDGKSNEKKK